MNARPQLIIAALAGLSACTHTHTAPTIESTLPHTVGVCEVTDSLCRDSPIGERFGPDCETRCPADGWLNGYGPNLAIDECIARYCIAEAGICESDEDALGYTVFNCAIDHGWYQRRPPPDDATKPGELLISLGPRELGVDAPTIEGLEGGIFFREVQRCSYNNYYLNTMNPRTPHVGRDTFEVETTRVLGYKDHHGVLLSAEIKVTENKNCLLKASRRKNHDIRSLRPDYEPVAQSPARMNHWGGVYSVIDVWYWCGSETPTEFDELSTVFEANDKGHVPLPFGHWPRSEFFFYWSGRVNAPFWSCYDSFREEVLYDGFEQRVIE